MDKSTPLLGNITVDDFLGNYWQKKPCIFKQAFSVDGLDLLSVDELAGLALEASIESRLILGNTRNPNQSKQVTLQHGPFSELTLSQLPETDWTLLIQSIDLWDEKFNALLHWANFLPRWRLDDIMVSIAAAGGGVGPHRDQYDVFLLQIQGQRDWKIASPNQDPDVLVGNELLQVPPFTAEIAESLQPGDILYLPPAWRHWGVANNLCVTTSIGFRAPSAEDLIVSLSDELSAVSTQRFADPWRNSQTTQSITEEDVEEVRTKITSILEDDNLLAMALGQQVTQPKIALEPLEASEVAATMKAIVNNPQQKFSLHPVSRVSYFESDGHLTVYANGMVLKSKLDPVSKPWLEHFCQHLSSSFSDYPCSTKALDSTTQLLNELIQLDAIVLDD